MLKNNQIGRNLKLHPTSFGMCAVTLVMVACDADTLPVFGVWPEEIKPWEGKHSFESSHGHGCSLS